MKFLKTNKFINLIGDLFLITIALTFLISIAILSLCTLIAVLSLSIEAVTGFDLIRLIKQTLGTL